MPDISIDQAKAKIWLDDVKAELDAVSDVLRKVNKVVTDPAGSDDAIMNEMYRFGTSLETSWNSMCKSFDVAQTELVKALDKIFKSAEEVIQEVGTLKTKV